jgi:hypothetical protein
MAISVLINDIDRATYVQMSSIQISENLVLRSSTLAFELWLSPDLISTARPIPENIIEIRDGNYTEFKGVILSVQEARVSAVHFTYTCRCVDWSRFFNRRLVNKIYSNQLFSDVARDLIDTYVRGQDAFLSPTITSFFKYTGDSIPDSVDYRVAEKKWEYRSVSDCLNDLCGGNIAFTWFVEWDGTVHFRLLTDFNASFPNSDANGCAGPVFNMDTYLGQWKMDNSSSGVSFSSAGKTITGSGFEDIDIGDTVEVSGAASNNRSFTVANATSSVITVNETVNDEAAGNNVRIICRAIVAGLGDLMWEEDVANVKDRLIIRSAKIKGNSVYERPSVEPDSTFLSASYPIWPNLDDIDFTLNERTLNIKTDMQDGHPGDGVQDDDSIYVCFINRGFRRADLSPFVEGDYVEYGYAAEEEIPAVIVQDDDAIAEMNARDGIYGDGIYEYAVSKPEVRASTWDTVTNIAKAILVSEAWPEIRGSFATTIKGLRSGQRFRLTSSLGGPRFPPAWFTTHAGPGEEWLYITSVEKQVIRADEDDTTINYNVSFSSSRGLDLKGGGTGE